MNKLGFELSATCSANPTGITLYARGLINSICNNQSFLKDFNPALLYKLSRFSKRNYRISHNRAKSVWHFGNLAPLNKSYKIIHYLGSNLIEWKKTAIISTIYDLAIFKKENKIDSYTTDDFQKKRFKQLKTIAKRSDRIIAISQSTKNDFLQLFDYNPDKIEVIYPGISNNFFEKNNVDRSHVRAKYSIKRKYLFFLGAISIRKNVINMLKAFKQANLHKDFDFILAGQLTLGADKIVETIADLKLDSSVKLLGYIDDRDIIPLYTEAEAFIFPTFYEGFGIPIIEAMSCRTPVLISNTGAAIEVAGEYAISVDPYDVDSIKSGMLKLLETDSVDIEAAYHFAANFRYEKSAEKTIALYRQLV